jgi:hypothetical protein
MYSDIFEVIDEVLVLAFEDMILAIPAGVDGRALSGGIIQCCWKPLELIP